MKRLSLFFFLANLVLVMQANTNLDNELFEAIRSERPDSEVVHDLLRDGANPNAQQDGETAIMVAIKLYRTRERHDILDELINAAKKTKSLDFIADNGMTALTYAADLNKSEAIELLLKRGAKRDKADVFNHTFNYYLNLSENERAVQRSDREFKRELKKFEIIERPAEEEWTIIDV